MSGTKPGRLRLGLVLPLFLLLLLGAPAASHGWRETGHYAVCEIAWRQLSDGARQEISRILEGRDFATQCTWPDLARLTDEWSFTYVWHFINLEDGEDYFDDDTLNADGDVLRALLEAERRLRDPEASARDQRIFLRFLAHFAGDVHQPLHTGRRSDRGGNEVKVSWFGARTVSGNTLELLDADPESCRRAGHLSVDDTNACLREKPARQTVNLHRIWDLLMIERFMALEGLEAEPGDSKHLHKAYATALASTLTAAELKDLRSSTYWDWVRESLDERDQVYDVGKGYLGKQYYDRHIALLNRRIAQAGHRLAFTLERLFGERSPQDEAVEARLEELARRLGALLGAAASRPE